MWIMESGYIRTYLLMVWKFLDWAGCLAALPSVSPHVKFVPSVLQQLQWIWKKVISCQSIEMLNHLYNSVGLSNLLHRVNIWPRSHALVLIHHRRRWLKKRFRHMPSCNIWTLFYFYFLLIENFLLYFCRINRYFCRNKRIRTTFEGRPLLYSH